MAVRARSNIDNIFCLAGITVRDEPAGTGDRVVAETLVELVKNNY